MKKLQKSRYIPEGAQEEKFDHVNAIAYRYEAKGLPAATVYHGKSIKFDFSYRFRNLEQRENYISEWLKRLEAWEERKQKRKEEQKAFVNPLKVGDIVYNSWGYDQTNIDFYEVVKSTNKTVSLRGLNSKIKMTGFMSGETVPAESSYSSNDITIHKVSAPCMVHFEHGAGFLWDGEPLHCSWYA